MSSPGEIATENFRSARTDAATEEPLIVREDAAPIDTPSPIPATPRIPWVSGGLVLANLLVYAAMAAKVRLLGGFSLPTLLDWGANFGPLTIGGQWWRLLTSIFLHLNLAHLLINMWVLWKIGALAERLYGGALLLALYLAAGLLASLSSLAWDPTVASVGASGAIFGVFGSLLAIMSHPRIRIPPALLRARWLSMAVFLLFSLVSGTLHTGIDNAAHAGGLVSGFVLGWLLARPQSPGNAVPERHLVPAIGFAAVAVVAALWVGGASGVRLTPAGQFLTMPGMRGQSPGSPSRPTWRSRAWSASSSGRAWTNVPARCATAAGWLRCDPPASTGRANRGNSTSRAARAPRSAR